MDQYTSLSLIFVRGILNVYAPEVCTGSVQPSGFRFGSKISGSGSVPVMIWRTGLNCQIYYNFLCINAAAVGDTLGHKYSYMKLKATEEKEKQNINRK